MSEFDWDDELEDFLKDAATSITQQAALLKPTLFDVGIGEALSTQGQYLTIFIRAEEDQEGYSLSLCLERESAAKLITGLVAGYRFLYGGAGDE